MVAFLLPSPAASRDRHTFVAGLLVLGATLWVTAPGLMMLEDESPYDHEETLAVFEEEAEAHGWSS